MSPSTSTSSSRPAASSSGSSKLRLRQTARPSELILLAVTQLLSVAYAVVVLPSRSSVPAFLPELSDILDPYIVNAPLALVWSCAGLAVVQTYTGYRFAVWSGRVTPAEGANDPPLLVWSKQAWEIVTAILFIATLLFLAIISLGAPVSRKLLETGLLSLFLALLAFGPAAWVIRPLVPGKPSPPSAWTRLFALMK
ncbi:Glycosylphosphatidylinositol (GPI) anchor assembly protein [Cystobasidiomycetes sp. EMM_F5]